MNVRALKLLWGKCESMWVAEETPVSFLGCEDMHRLMLLLVDVRSQRKCLHLCPIQRLSTLQQVRAPDFCRFSWPRCLPSLLSITHDWIEQGKRFKRLAGSKKQTTTTPCSSQPKPLNQWSLPEKTSFFSFSKGFWTAAIGQPLRKVLLRWRGASKLVGHSSAILSGRAEGSEELEDGRKRMTVFFFVLFCFFFVKREWLFVFFCFFFLMVGSWNNGWKMTGTCWKIAGKWAGNGWKMDAKRLENAWNMARNGWPRLLLMLEGFAVKLLNLFFS